jgi:hypothetical protein
MNWLRSNWRSILARLPLPTLALAAAYGVWRFQALFTPWYVAAISALSFELVYIGLAVVQLAPGDRKRATLISVGAVVVSVIYNSLSALFEIRPALLINRPLWADVILAVVHGLPLAAVAFFVADLLLHTGTAPVVESAAAPPDSTALAIVSAPLSRTEQVRRLALQMKQSESTIWRKVKAGDIVLSENESGVTA